MSFVAVHASSVAARVQCSTQAVARGALPLRQGAVVSRPHKLRLAKRTGTALRAATTEFTSSPEPDPWAEEVRPAEETKAERDELKHRLLGKLADTRGPITAA